MNAVLRPLGHVVTQVVEPELVGGAKGNIAHVHLTAVSIDHRILDDTDGETEILIDSTHPVAVALSQVIVDSDDMDTLALQSVQINRHGSNQRLTLTGGHLSNLALMQRDPADELDVKRHHIPLGLDPGHIPACPQMMTTGFLDHGECFRHDVVKRLARFQPFFELVGFGFEFLLGEVFQFLELFVNLSNGRLHFPGIAIVLGTEYPGDQVHHRLLGSSAKLSCRPKPRLL